MLTARGARPVTRIATPSVARAVLSEAIGRSTGSCPRASSTPKRSRAQWMSVASTCASGRISTPAISGASDQLRREDPVDEDEAQPVGAFEHRLLVGGQQRRRRRRKRGQPAGSVNFQYSSRRTGAPRSASRRAARARAARAQPASPAGLGPRREQRLGAAQLQCRDRHQATVLRMSA